MVSDNVMMLVESVRQSLAARGIGRVVVAVSGGPDSTALLLAMHELRLDVLAAHVNHHLRDDESDGDERFVRALCTRLGIALEVADGTLDPESVRHRGVEAAAREVRHARLHAIRERAGMQWIATAHQLDDQAETVLMRLMTGSGLAGLRGIHPVRDDGVVRPMLAVTRAEVEAFLRERGVVARTDSSNVDARFLRNRVRALLREVPESARRNLAATAEQAAEQWSIVERLLDSYDVEETEDATRFVEWPEHVWLRQALLLRHIRRLDPHSRDVSAVDLERLATTRARVSVTKELELEGDVLRRRGQAGLPVLHFLVEVAAGESVYIPEIGTTVHLRPSGQRFQLPPGATPAFIVRNRKPGDRFRPLGMSVEKKLKDFFIDRKIDRDLRDRIPLLVWNGEIVWVGGIEISDAFKVTDPAGGEQYEVWLERAGASVEAQSQT
jgi:tRNA(Ile)-lysidine synthase